MQAFELRQNKKLELRDVDMNTWAHRWSVSLTQAHVVALPAKLDVLSQPTMGLLWPASFSPVVAGLSPLVPSVSRLQGG